MFNVSRPVTANTVDFGTVAMSANERSVLGINAGDRVDVSFLSRNFQILTFIQLCVEPIDKKYPPFLDKEKDFYKHVSNVLSGKYIDKDVPIWTDYKGFPYSLKANNSGLVSNVISPIIQFTGVEFHDPSILTIPEINFKELGIGGLDVEAGGIIPSGFCFPDVVRRNA